MIMIMYQYRCLKCGKITWYMNPDLTEKNCDYCGDFYSLIKIGDNSGN